MPRGMGEPKAPRHSDEVRQRYRDEAPRISDDGLDLVEVFGESTDIEMEIGYGRGAFLMGRAEAAPGSVVVGVEVKTKWAFLVAERCKRLGLGNAHPYAGDARRVLPALRPDESLARMFLHFPDPWWKKRHAKRRLLDTALAAQTARLLRPGGELFAQTDVQERHQAYVDLFRDHDAFDVRELDHNPYGAQSNRERRAIEDGNPVYRVLAVKRG